MKSYKFLLAIAAILAISNAFANQNNSDVLLYHWTGFSYLPAWGEPGENYVCVYYPIEVCTYYYDYYSGLYIPYEFGQYYDISL